MSNSANFNFIIKDFPGKKGVSGEGLEGRRSRTPRFWRGGWSGSGTPESPVAQSATPPEILA